MICFFFSRLWRDCSGYGAMELALATPFLFLLNLGMADTSMLIGTKIDWSGLASLFGFQAFDSAVTVAGASVELISFPVTITESKTVYQPS
ncbi:hypothetical protein LY632_06525 [Erythrobacter sp. SDW2]|uniref:TadE/TadG family type IV pilus assembly protein n=1 Tax=Erythrobacter sp. SDW2 TaxID=2907154 RepID=UPI001F47C5C9|nr:hypothetical protein [Erythrobacter sp. SDW2]UIP08043.1 hypothetical protein LY632_06525 [Erythrobacter sp. SDW2]